MPPTSTDLELLAERIATACFAQVCSAAKSRQHDQLRRVAGAGVGDTTFGIDTEPEAIVAAWAEDLACEAPLSVLTEDTGWRHLGPDSRGGYLELAGFDHGGPRIVIDPVDGSRNLMFDLRSAWAAIAMAPPGPATPLLSDLTHAVVQELPTSQAASAKRFVASLTPATCQLSISDMAGQELSRSSQQVDTSDQVDHGFFPFFRFHTESRVQLAQLEQAFLLRLQDHEGANLDAVFDDQYISNAGQLMLLVEGKYRMVADLRGCLGGQAITSKPYDIAAATVVARAAGAIVNAPGGRPLDTLLDATTPVSFVAFANAQTATRLTPHLSAAFQGNESWAACSD